MKKRNQQEFDPNVPITVTPANHPALSEGATIAKVAVIEAIGVGINHAFHWSWWVGAQLPVAYLFWRLMHERAFYTRIVLAWNKRLAPER